MGKVSKASLMESFIQKREFEIIKQIFDGHGIKNHHDAFVITTSAREAMRTILSCAAFATQVNGMEERTLPLLIERGSRFFNPFQIFTLAAYTLGIKTFDLDLVPENVIKGIEDDIYSNEIGSDIEKMETERFRALMGYLAKRVSSDEWDGKGLDKRFAYHFLKRLGSEMDPATILAIMSATLVDEDMSDEEFEVRKKIANAINAAFFSSRPDVVYGLFGGRQATYPRDVGHEGKGDNEAPCEEDS